MIRLEPELRILAWRFLRDGVCGHRGVTITGAAAFPCSCPHHWRRAYRLSKILHPMHDVCATCHGQKAPAPVPEIPHDLPF